MLSKLSNLSEDPADEVVVLAKVLMQEVHVRVWIQEVVLGESKKASVWVESSFKQLGKELTKHSTSIHPNLIQPHGANELHSHHKAQLRLCEQPLQL